MRRLFVWALFVPALAGTLAMPAVARAIAIALPPPGPQRVALADAVLVGRVTALEDKDVEVDIPGAQQKVKYRIAIVTVAEDIRNAKALKTVRVGFFPPPAGQPDQPIRPIPRPGFQRVELKVGQEALFYLTKHEKESFYLVPNYYDVTAKDAPNFKKDHEEAKLCAKLLADPMAGLKSKDSKERLLTAALLINQYRTPRAGGAKLEAINADESKLILTALADADWTPANRYDQIHPMILFDQLGVTATDGFERPTKIFSPQDYPNAIRAWLKEKAGTFRIQRYVGGTPINTGGFDPRILPYIDPVLPPPIEILPPQK